MSKKTVVLDFDGVLHCYTSGWQGSDVIPDPPVPGAKEFCEELVKYYDVIVVSTRCSQGASDAIERWLKVYGFPGTMTVSQTGQKPPCVLTIDDRAFCFSGTFPTIGEIRGFRPWKMT